MSMFPKLRPFDPDPTLQLKFAALSVDAGEMRPPPRPPVEVIENVTRLAKLVRVASPERLQGQAAQLVELMECMPAVATLSLLHALVVRAPDALKSHVAEHSAAPFADRLAHMERVMLLGEIFNRGRLARMARIARMLNFGPDGLDEKEETEGED